VTANSVADDKIDCRNLRYSRSSPRPATASATKDNMMGVVVVVVVKVVAQFEFADGRGQSSSDGIFFSRWEVCGT
jgi:hypothetical protein